MTNPVADYAPAVIAGYLRRLSGDLADGNWDRRYRHLPNQPEFDGSLVLARS